MARQIKERMGTTTANTKPTVPIGQGQGVQSGSGGGCFRGFSSAQTAM